MTDLCVPTGKRYLDHRYQARVGSHTRCAAVPKGTQASIFLKASLPRDVGGSAACWNAASTPVVNLGSLPLSVVCLADF